MTKLVTTALASALALLGGAGPAFAGRITDGAEVKVNGKAAEVPIAVGKGDVVETGSAQATFTSDAGDVIRLDPATTARSLGLERGVEYLFVASGAASGALSDRTSLGLSTAWAVAARGRRTAVQVEAPKGRAARAGLFRTSSGDGTWLRSRAFSTWVPVGHAVVLDADPSQPETLRFRTGQQNAGPIEVEVEVEGGRFRVLVPRATTGVIAGSVEGGYEITNDAVSPRQSGMRIEGEFGWSSVSTLGPGATARLDPRGPGVLVDAGRTFAPPARVVPAYDPTEASSTEPARPRPDPKPTAPRSSAAEDPVPPPVPTRGR